jgi:hypothetical protein
MTEISKRMKIVITINIIVAFIYGFFYLIITETYSKLIDAPYYDPGMWQIFGGTLVLLGIFGLLALKKNEWEYFKILVEFVILWDTLLLIINIVNLFIIPSSAVNRANALVSIILLIVLIILWIYSYLQEEK